LVRNPGFAKKILPQKERGGQETSWEKKKRGLKHSLVSFKRVDTKPCRSFGRGDLRFFTDTRIFQSKPTAGGGEGKTGTRKTRAAGPGVDPTERKKSNHLARGGKRPKRSPGV